MKVRNHFLFWLALTGAVPLAAQEPAATPQAAVELRRFEVSKASSEIKVDGILDEAAWTTATVIDLPYEWFPGDNVPPPVKTDALLTFDEDNVYVAFRAFDPDPSAIRANLMDRDNLGPFVQDDHIGFVIDTFNDERRAFHFRVNPLGVQVDGIFSEQTAAEDYSWDAIWGSAATINAEGYVVETAIPLKQLRFPRTSEVQTWGFEAFRSYPRNVRVRISSRHTDRQKDCLLCQENKVTGFTNLKTGRNLELIPTLTAESTDALADFPDGDLETVEEDVEVGASLRWGITPNVTLSATVNPDFSQVEADAAQLAINTRFALFFPEKRPFFLEGAELFQTPLQAVFTRTVADPKWGAKLSAKEGKNTLGLFVAEDRITNILLPGNQGSRLGFIDDNVTSGAFHYTREVGKFSALGVLYAGREGQGYHNHVGGLDGFLRFTPSDTVKVQYLNSNTEYPDAFAQRFRQPLGSFDGNAFSIKYDHFAKLWKGFLRYEDIDPEFRADSGFMPRVDVKTAEGQYLRTVYGQKGGWYSQMQFGARGLRTENHDGRLTDQEIELFGAFNGPRQSAVTVNLFDNKQFFAGRDFDTQQVWLFGQFNPAANVRTSLAYRFGDDVDFDNARPGEFTLISPNLFVRLGKHLSVELDYLRRNLDIDAGRLFTAELAQSTVIYNFNVRSFIRGIVQYQNIERDPNLYLFAVNEETEDFFFQFLFSYKINPRTVLFMGYTDTRFGVDEISLTQTDRTLFLKIGYAFLF